MTGTRIACWLRPLVLPALFALSALTGACLEADTLGDEPPDEVQVGDPPAWDNGMQELLALKCAVCHQLPRPRTAPNETPDEFDLRYQFGSGEFDGAADILEDIQEIVADGKMPPIFATSLTDSEKDAIQNWDGN